MMKKLVVQIHQQRFELESKGQAQDNLIQTTVRQLNVRIEKLRREHGFPDNTRATALALLLLALEKNNSAGGKDGATADKSEESAKMVQALERKVEVTLARTHSSPAKAPVQ